MRNDDNLVRGAGGGLWVLSFPLLVHRAKETQISPSCGEEDSHCRSDSSFLKPASHHRQNSIKCSGPESKYSPEHILWVFLLQFLPQTKPKEADGKHGGDPDDGGGHAPI